MTATRPSNSSPRIALLWLKSSHLEEERETDKPSSDAPVYSPATISLFSFVAGCQAHGFHSPAPRPFCVSFSFSRYHFASEAPRCLAPSSTKQNPQKLKGEGATRKIASKGQLGCWERTIVADGAQDYRSSFPLLPYHPWRSLLSVSTAQLPD